MRSEYDVAVVGAGPAGTATAVAHARNGHRVLLVEAKPRACSRFAGEWLHPPAVEVLQRLGLEPVEEISQHPGGRGFVVFPDDGSDPITLPYADGTLGIACEHQGLVHALRSRAADLDAIDYLPHTRVVELADRWLLLSNRREGSTRWVRADRIVGADGRSSIVRRHLEATDNGTTVSYMAGVEMSADALPFEGYGHVLLGGPGPVMMYRIGPNRVRACLDLPADDPALRRQPDFLWDAFAPVFPEHVRPAFKQALEDRRVSWATNRFRPRVHYGEGHLALVGDAVGYYHPLTAVGITMGVLDGETLAQSSSVDAYRRRREERSWVAELLTSALYQVLTRDDPSAASIRQAVYRVWRTDEAECRRTMRILSGQEVSRVHFGSAFLRMATDAVRQTVHESVATRRWSTLAERLGAFREWARWPAASVLPSLARRSRRPRATPWHPTGARGPMILPARSAPKLETSSTLVGEDVQEVVVTNVELLREALAEAPSVGQPDRLAREARLLAALNAAGAEPAHATRAEARRDLLERALDDRETAPAADVLLALLESNPDHDLPLARVEQLVRALLSHRTADGGFGEGFGLRGAVARPDATWRACRALRAVQDAFPGLLIGPIEQALSSATTWFRQRQRLDGAWPGAVGHPNIRATSCALDALLTAGAPPYDPGVRRGRRWLIDQQGSDGRWRESAPGEEAPAGALATARAVYTLLRARAPWRDAILLGLEAVVHDARSDELGQSPAALETRRTQLRALALERHRVPLRPGDSAYVGTDQDHAPPSPADREFCEQSLQGVSRTFSRPIAMLPGNLRTAVTCGYLLCRIADTIEDHPTLELDEREGLYASFLDVLYGEERSDALAARFSRIDGSGPELELAAEMPRLMRLFHSLPEQMQTACMRWVAEMTRGMSLYSHRRPGRDGIIALETLDDLQRYCYFVAGTVGHMLTDLFLAEYGDTIDEESALTLRNDAEAFGLGLQLVNILKDVTDDRACGWSFIPRTVCAEQGLELEQLLDADKRRAAHAAVAPIFDVARGHLDRALRYTLALPHDADGVRLFCLLPLWMAVRTLVHARGNDAMFIAGEPVKIDRQEVESLIRECFTICRDNQAIEEAYEALWAEPAEAGARRRSA